MSAPKLIALSALALLLASCQSMSPEERRAADENQCASYGFRRGTEAFATCLQRVELDRRAELRSRHETLSMQAAWQRPVYIVRPVVVRPRRR